MSKSLNLAKVSAKGGFNLFWGVAVNSIISALGVMIIAGILTEGEYGIYTIALIAPQLTMLFRDFGIDNATIKYTAQFNQENKQERIKNIIKATTIFEIIMGLILSITVLILSDFIAINIFNRPETTTLLQIASFTTFGGALIKIADSAFIGYEKMHYHSITLIVQSTLKTLIMILLVISGFGVFGAIVGHTMAVLITGIISVIILYLKIYKKIKNQNKDNKIISNLKSLFKYGLPLSGSLILNGVTTQFYNILIAIYLTNQIIGNYHVALNFSIIATFFVTPISTIMFPAFSKINGQKEPTTLKNVYQFSVKYASLLILPTTFLLMVLSKPAVSLIFGEKYPLTPLYLSLYVILYLFTAVGHLSSENLLKSQGRTDINLKLSMVSATIGIILALTLIPKYGIIGLITTILISKITNLTLSLFWIKKHYKFTLNWKSSTKILTSSITSAIITYLIINHLNLTNWITLILGAIIYITTYIITAPIMKAINQEDIKTLKEMLKDLGPIATMINIPLNIINKLAK